MTTMRTDGRRPTDCWAHLAPLCLSLLLLSLCASTVVIRSSGRCRSTAAAAAAATVTAATATAATADVPVAERRGSQRRRSGRVVRVEGVESGQQGRAQEGREGSHAHLAMCALHVQQQADAGLLRDVRDGERQRETTEEEDRSEVSPSSRDVAVWRNGQSNTATICYC